MHVHVVQCNFLVQCLAFVELLKLFLASPIIISYIGFCFKCDVLSIANCKVLHKWQSKETQKVSMRMQFPMLCNSQYSRASIIRLGNFL